jgi:hypothetical protein
VGFALLALDGLGSSLSLSLSLVLLFHLCWVLCLMEFFRVSSPSIAFFFGPSFPPLLGALFNGVCQGFITFNGFFFFFFVVFQSKEQLFCRFKAFVDKISRNFCGPGLGFRV